ncbi:MAG: LysM peptidoglycan-binding domain-containing protein, partial [Candidatus Promineifilaceae bacterium]
VPGVSADSTYVVQRGETLFRIALNHGLTTGQLAQANNIINPDVIYAGQVLIIPDGESETEVSPPEPESTMEQVSVSTYVVQRGDTLFRIALRFGVSTQAMAQANGISNPSYIYAGQTLTIPDAGSGTSPETNPLPIAPISYGERWIDVNLTTQRLTAYEEKQPVYSTAISSGLWPHTTVTGLFEVYVRYESQTMNGYRLGYDYYLPNVPYVMYFYRDYAIHGTYWHNNFGTPMSHGCVNTPTPDAQWLYFWSSYGTPVNVHF